MDIHSVYAVLAFHGKRINTVIMDIHNSVTNIHDLIMDTQNQIMDIHISIMDIHN